MEIASGRGWHSILGAERSLAISRVPGCLVGQGLTTALTAQQPHIRACQVQHAPMPQKADAFPATG